MGKSAQHTEGRRVGEESATAAVGDATEKLDQRAMIFIGAVVLAGFVPAAYLGALATGAIAQISRSPVSGIVVVGIGGILLGALGAAAYGVANKWPRSLPVVAGSGIAGLAGVSLWMLIALEEAREGVVAFAISAVVLALIVGFIKVFDSLS